MAVLVWATLINLKKKSIYINTLWLLFLVTLSLGVTAQNIKVQGVVKDSISGEPLPFVNVVFKGKNIGTMTDINGRYLLESEWGSHVVQFSSVGYIKKEVPITDKSNQKINVLLVPSVQQLKVVEIKGKRHRYKNKDNPAVILIRNILAHRDENRGVAFKYYEYEKYEKNQYDINNFSSDWFNSRSMRGFQVLGDYVDTSSLNGKPFIPVFIQEKVSKVYEKDFGKHRVEYVTNTKVSGVDNGDITSGIDQLVGKLGGEVDIYENNILLFDKSFTSPISNIGPNIYRYYITDSIKVDGHVLKKLSFMPRNKSMIAFTGFMWVGDSTYNYAIQEIELNIDKRTNVNFLDDMRVTQTFTYDTVSGWHKVKDIMIIDFQPMNRALGIYNTKTISYQNFKANIPQDEELYSGLNEIKYINEADQVSDWDSLRHDTLSNQEQDIYVLVDTIQNTRQYKLINNAIFLFTEGYVSAKKLEFGPVATIMSYNTIEGIRVRGGFRTSRKLSKTWRFTGWVAYGFDDKRFKHSEQFEYYFRKNPNRYLSVSYSDNLIQPGQNTGWIEPDNFLNSFTRTPTTNRFYVRDLSVLYEHEWVPGFGNSIQFTAMRMDATRFNPLMLTDSVTILNGIIDNSVTVGLRFSRNERYIQGVFKRVAIKSEAPVFKLNYSYSGPGLGSDYEYHKLNLEIEKRFMLGLFGYTDLDFMAGKIWGRVPYPLLIIHPGNEAITYVKKSYNLMNFMEFASDESVSLMLEHHFNGLLIGLIPLVNHTKMRVVASGKILYGRINSQNIDKTNPDLILPPERLRSLTNKPYAEGSIGIENIFNIMRVDLVKRFTYLDSPKIGNFLGVKGLAPRIAFSFKF